MKKGRTVRMSFIMPQAMFNWPYVFERMML